MVLTHLILNDMVKVKGQISEMATCLEDKDARIADLAKLFFLELSKKVSVDLLPFPIYISFGDCFKALSHEAIFSCNLQRKFG